MESSCLVENKYIVICCFDLMDVFRIALVVVPLPEKRILV